MASMNRYPTAGRRQRPCRLPAVVLGVLFLPLAQAQEAGAWRFSASVYGYLPSISGKTTFPAEPGTGIEVDASKILDSLKMTFMGSLDVNNGRWGVFSDVIYLDLGNSKTNTRNFSIGDAGVPAGTTADLRFDFKSWVWTVAGEYMLASEPHLTIGLMGGARMIDLKQTLEWDITGSLGPLSPAGRSGSSEVDATVWDAIVGVKGRYAFGDQRRWKLPFYLDIGTGESKMTWQAAAGIGYAFGWGEVNALYRYLDYDMKSGMKIKSIRFNGPMLGATFRW